MLISASIKAAFVVALPLGRVGSSAVMGLLGIAGVNVGQPRSLVSPSPMNPKGFFELTSQEEFLKRVYRGIYPDVGPPPSMELIEEVAKTHVCDFAALLRSEFGDRVPIGLKSSRHLTLPFFRRLRDEWEVKVLVMERNSEDQISSMMRVWRNTEDPIKRNATREMVASYLEEWKEFAQRVRELYQFDYLPVCFDRLISDPVNSTRRIMAFLGIPCPPPQAISKWLDRSLVNRKSY